jgi:hypothetical protein
MAFRVVVTGFIGAGTSPYDPFRADVALPAAVVGMAIVDLSDITTHDLCVAVLDYGDGVASQPATRADGTTGGAFWDLGEDPFAFLSAARRNQIASRLGITLSGNVTIGAVALVKLGARLKAGRDGMLRVRCGRLTLHEQLAISGGATDAFTYSNGNLETVSSAAWVKHTYLSVVTGTLTVASNVVQVPSSADTAYRYGTAMGSTDHYAQFVINNAATGGDTAAGPMTRMSTGTTNVSGYWAGFGSFGFLGAGSHYTLQRCDLNASFTSLATTAGSAGTRTVKLESDGSTHTVSIGGVETVFDTDTTFTTETSVGIYAYEYTTNIDSVDDFEADVLTPPASPAVILRGPIRSALRLA